MYVSKQRATTWQKCTERGPNNSGKYDLTI